MTNYVLRMAELCRQRNDTVRSSYVYGDMDLDNFAMLQARKVMHNRRLTPLRDSADLINAAADRAEFLLGRDIIPGLKKSLEEKVICTADHHGSLYCAQFLQGDFLFALVMEKLGITDSPLPVLGAGQVELENSTYSRGICAYSSADKKEFIPVFPAKYSVQLASHADPISREMIDRLRKRFGDIRAIDEIAAEIYEDEAVFSAQSFSDQTTLIAKKLMERLISPGGPSFVYLEMEKVIEPILLEELSDDSSLLYRLIYDKRLREIAAATPMADGLTILDLMFRSVDEKGRKIMLSLSGDMLVGSDWRKEKVTYKTDKEKLTRLIKQRTVLPGVFTETLLLFFERGISWMGGMFQASYLSAWQKNLADLLEKAGCEKESELIRAYDCTGYICGPMMALHKVTDHATPMGPVEIWPGPIDFDIIRKLAKGTSLWDAHMIGLSEMYFDLTSRDEREDDWYRKIAKELFLAYPGNMVTYGRE
ncbi:hypothetical protein [Butyrivibrio sp. MC2013]|uniref:hypothetical protein n=1 Tax=Butyrivibrio sp. MC2013 TaxID=1280686 RepID=UPI0004249C63|nr:hypothetical protein [Butyrivibrio sp. MC2013]